MFPKCRFLNLNKPTHIHQISRKLFANDSSLKNSLSFFQSNSSTLKLFRSSDNSVRCLSIKIYTKTGDKGTSSLFNGERRPKDDVVFEALGNTDELNASIGFSRQLLEKSINQEMEDLTNLRKQLEKIQNILLDIGSNIATPRDHSSDFKLQRASFDPNHITNLEKWIDSMDEQLPPLKNFILPGGGETGSFLHVARAVCRRAERSVVPLVRDGKVDPNVGIFLNRLSDYLFMSARFVAKKQNHSETIYQKSSQTNS